MGKLEYLAVLGACVLVTLPLELAGARVYRRPRRLARAVLPVARVFLAWDAVAIAGGVWDYTPETSPGSGHRSASRSKRSCSSWSSRSAAC